MNANRMTSKCTYSKLCYGDDHDMCMNLIKSRLTGGNPKYSEEDFYCALWL